MSAASVQSATTASQVITKLWSRPFRLLVSTVIYSSSCYVAIIYILEKLIIQILNGLQRIRIFFEVWILVFRLYA